MTNTRATTAGKRDRKASDVQDQSHPPRRQKLPNGLPQPRRSLQEEHDQASHPPSDDPDPLDRSDFDSINRNEAENGFEAGDDFEADGEVEEDDSSTMKDKSGNDRHKGVNLDLPPISDLSGIFPDLSRKAMTMDGSENLQTHLHERVINVATMCSGTEAPLLALNMICSALEIECGLKIKIQHRFSAEIVPFKQAYIESNFRPPLIFRDIRDIYDSKDGKAYTAYGSRVEIPRDVDILVAGFSCVDFSKLNSWNKRLEETGESGDTLRAIMTYAQKFRPAIIILENVTSSPWPLIKAMWENDMESIKKLKQSWESIWSPGEVPYKAVWMRLDSKDYYIPQTRIRGYMFLVRTDLCDSDKDITALWEKSVRDLQRPASVSVESFLLHDDDARLQRGMLDMIRSGRGNKGEVEWTIMEGNHQEYRKSAGLSKHRFFTKWNNGGTATAPDHFWIPWFSVQVERVWDTIELSQQRKVLKGYDSFYKTRVWDLSQSIDRSFDTPPHGISLCLTPTGIPFVSNLGRPIIGIEALALQGIPVDGLILSRQTQRQQRDLAGNAMTATVVGAAILAALMVAAKPLSEEIAKRTDLSSVVGATEEFITDMDYSQMRDQEPLEFATPEPPSARALIDAAFDTVRLCRCEGQHGITTKPLLICVECGHHSCATCGKWPTHHYAPVIKARVSKRRSPQDFRGLIKKSLPMLITIGGFVPERLEKLIQEAFGNVAMRNLDVVLKAAKEATQEPLRFSNITRTQWWSIKYESSKAMLELKFTPEQAQWLLFGKVDPKEPGKSPVREILKQPFARMTVKGDDLYHGDWEFYVPAQNTYPLVIEGKGDMTPSWRARIGLQDYLTENVHSTLQIRCAEKGRKIPGCDIQGDYKLLPKCGTAQGSLHKRVSPLSSLGSSQKFFFLEQDPIGATDYDTFVFSADIHRLEKQEHRQCYARMDQHWRQSEEQTTRARCTISGRWLPFRASIAPFEKAIPAMCATCVPEPVMNVFRTTQSISGDFEYDCKTATTALLSLQVPLLVADQKRWPRDKWTVIDQTTEREVFKQYAWLVDRIQRLDGFSSDWRSLEKIPEPLKRCFGCAPKIASIKWERSKKAKKKILPYEDSKEAALYETKLKARPTPFRIQHKIDVSDSQAQGLLQIGLNVASLAHRALARLPDLPQCEDRQLSWRLVTGYEAPLQPTLEPLHLEGTQDYRSADYKFPIPKEKLRPDQQSSLAWMIDREAAIKVWTEQEIEEAVVTPLGWRAEVRATQRRHVRGGVIADVVGFGKTATMLALINKNKQEAADFAKTDRCGLLKLKATLVIVPATIVKQWGTEARKFLGGGCKVLTLAHMKALADTTVKAFKEADIIVVPFDMFKDDKYWSKVALLAALPESTSIAGKTLSPWQVRAFGTWHAQVSDRICNHADEIRDPLKVPGFASKLKKDFEKAEKDPELYREVPSQRFRGARYLEAAQTRACDKGSVDIKAEKEGSAPALRSYSHIEVDVLDAMKSPCFELFDFARIVVDEYTYPDETLCTIFASLRSPRRWILSGTPPMEGFADIQKMGRLIGVHLGVPDDMRNPAEEKTDSEMFRSFLQNNTSAWLEARHSHAQTFCSVFVRQSTIEHDDIVSVEELRPVHMNALEMVTHRELQSTLESTEWQIVRSLNKFDQGDRDRTADTFLRTSKTAEEALLKSASHLDTSEHAVNTSRAFQAKRDLREAEIDAIKEVLTTEIHHAVWLDMQIQRCIGEKRTAAKTQNDKKTTSSVTKLQEVHFKKFKIAVERGDFAHDEAKKILSGLWEDKAKICVQGHVSNFYRNKPSDEDIKKEKNERTRHLIRREADTTEQRRYPFIDRSDYDGFVSAMRLVVAQLRRDTKELVSRLRSLQFMYAASRLVDSINEAEKVVCGKCSSARSLEDLLINVSCGHITCRGCIDAEEYVDHCLHMPCDTPSERHRLLTTEELVGSNQAESKYGAKLDAIIHLIKDEIASDDQVLVFVQYDDLSDAISRAFGDSGITYDQINSSTKASKAETAMENFRNATDAETMKKVLILNSTSEKAAGINLQNVNHIIFVHPTLTQHQHSYNQSRKQCIGRSRRFGQTKTVKIYDFLALKTFDVDLFEERQHAQLIQKKATEFVMALAGNVDHKEVKQIWGSGHYNRFSRDEAE